MNSEKITETFLKYFEKHKHKIVPSDSLIPEMDPTLLLTSAGMVQFKQALLGKQKPIAPRVANIQRCFRTGDIDEIGNRRHLTFFFMMGSWSFGDYFKEGAVDLAYDLIINGYKFDKDKIWATVFKGNKQVPKDIETKKAWLKYLPKERVVELGEKDNFWIVGNTGPCGPSTEIYYDRGKKFGCNKKSCKPGCDCDRFLEFWNAGVFIQYNKTEDGKLEDLPMKSVDTGAGLERFAALLQNKDSVFDVDIMIPITNKIKSLSKKQSKIEIRVIADHIRGAVFLIADGVRPSNLERGYILRRILRRIIRNAQLLEMKENYMEELVKIVIKTYEGTYYKGFNQKEILNTIEEEKQKFEKTLNKGLKKFKDFNFKKTISGKDAFFLYQSFGFPIEITKDLAKENKLKVDEKGFEKEFKKHQETSRAGVEKKFGGAGSFGEKVAAQHTATHLLHQALREVLGNEVKQAGSDLTPERIRFDFTFSRKLTDEEKKKVEDIVNKKIKEALPVKLETISLKEAKKMNAIGLFEEKYADKVQVVSVGNYSKEICAGPHVKNTKELKHFKIKKEKSSAAGIRRIKAVLD
ncbi:MAG: alanine--tRNA ligase [Nanoarchaeota archaeon]